MIEDNPAPEQTVIEMNRTEVELVTTEQALELSPEQSMELVQGEFVELVRPGVRHGVVCAELAYLLKSWNKVSHRGRIVANDPGVVTERDPDSVRGPDLFFIENERLPEGVPVGWVETPPNLCVEVLSPHDHWTQVLSKVHECLELGSDEIWMVDPELRRIQAFRRDLAPRILTEGDSLVSPELPGFECRVADLFAEC